MTTHSPGPWQWDPQYHSRNVLRASDGTAVGFVDEAIGVPDDTRHANRNLIASSPLLAAQVAELAAATNGLIEVMAMQEQRETGAFHLSAGSALAIWNDAKDKAMAALAKVRP